MVQRVDMAACHASTQVDLFDLCCFQTPDPLKGLQDDDLEPCPNVGVPGFANCFFGDYTQWNVAPSVGTWLLAPSFAARSLALTEPRRSEKTSITQLPHPSETAASPALGEQQSSVDRAWNLCPSVGTWLMPLSLVPAAKESHVVAEASAVTVVAKNSSAESPQPWNFRPSVGTWLIPHSFDASVQQPATGFACSADESSELDLRQNAFDMFWQQQDEQEQAPSLEALLQAHATAVTPSRGEGITAPSLGSDFFFGQCTLCNQQVGRHRSMLRFFRSDLVLCDACCCHMADPGHLHYYDVPGVEYYGAQATAVRMTLAFAPSPVGMVAYPSWIDPLPLTLDDLTGLWATNCGAITTVTRPHWYEKRLRHTLGVDLSWQGGTPLKYRLRLRAIDGTFDCNGARLLHGSSTTMLRWRYPSGFISLWRRQHPEALLDPDDLDNAGVTDSLLHVASAHVASRNAHKIHFASTHKRKALSLAVCRKISRRRPGKRQRNMSLVRTKKGTVTAWRKHGST